MIVIKDKNVIVNKKFEKEKLKEVKVFIIISLFLSIWIFIGFKLLGIVCISIYLILLLLLKYLYNKEWKETKIITFSKDNLVIYLKNEKKVINTSQIINFYYSTSNNYKNVIVKYRDEKNKKMSYAVDMEENDAYNFTNIANSLIDSNFANISDIDSIDYCQEHIVENKINNNLKKGEIIIARLIGKTRTLFRNGKNYSVKSSSSLVFVSKELVPIYIYLEHTKTDLSQIEIGCNYEIKCSKINKKYYIKKSDSNLIINDEGLKEIIKSLKVKNDTFFDEDIIKEELKYEVKYINYTNVDTIIMEISSAVIFFFMIRGNELIKLHISYDITTVILILLAIATVAIIHSVINRLLLKRKVLKLYK